MIVATLASAKCPQNGRMQTRFNSHLFSYISALFFLSFLTDGDRGRDRGRDRRRERKGQTQTNRERKGQTQTNREREGTDTDKEGVSVRG